VVVDALRAIEADPARPASATEETVVEMAELVEPEDESLTPSRRRRRGNREYLREEDEDDYPVRRDRASRSNWSAAEVLGLIAVILGIGSCLFAWISCFGVLTVPFSGVGFALGAVGVILAFLDKRRGLGLALGGCASCLLAIGLVAVFWRPPWTPSVNTATQRNRVTSTPKNQMASDLVAAQTALASADRFWTEGKHGEAVATYKTYHLHRQGAQKAELIKRIVEHELRMKNTEEARKWIEVGLTSTLSIQYESDAAKALLARVKKERDLPPFVGPPAPPGP
jgi:hypothetical protein